MAHTRESRVIALAGVVQACRLVRDVATGASAEAAASESSLASIFRIDADSATDVFGDVRGVKLGLECMISQLEHSKRDLALTRLVFMVLKLERKLAADRAMPGALRARIEAIQRQVDHLGIHHATIRSRLADVYVDTLSTLKPRVIVHGTPNLLADPQRVESIRALLLAGVRGAVLWRQVGGSQWRLLLRQQEYAMLARGLLARCTLDLG